MSNVFLLVAQGSGEFVRHRRYDGDVPTGPSSTQALMRRVQQQLSIGHSSPFLFSSSAWTTGSFETGEWSPLQRSG